MLREKYMSQNEKIPSRSEWKNLTVSDLYKTKLQMIDLMFKASSAGATFISQYQGFISEIDSLISQKESSASEN
jgi:uncharacterized membrane protein YqhA